MAIKARETQQRKHGKTIRTYVVVWKETMRDEFGMPVPEDPARPTGRKKKSQHQRTFATYAEAEQFEDDLRARRHRTAATSTSATLKAGDLPFAHYARAFFDSLAGTIKPDTIAEYEATYRRYLAPVFGSRAVATISPTDVRKFRTALLSPRPRRDYNTRTPAEERACRADDAQAEQNNAATKQARSTPTAPEFITLSRGTAKHAYDALRRILDVAVVDGALPSNPVHSLPFPRRTTVHAGQEVVELVAGPTAHPNHESRATPVPSGLTETPAAPRQADQFSARPLSADAVAAVVADITDRQGQPIYALAVLFSVFTGLRQAELQGLELRDLSLSVSGERGRRAGGATGGSLRVERTRTAVRGGWKVGTPKSEKSRRTVPIDGWLAEDMRRYLDEVHPYGPTRNGKTNPDYRPTAPVFPARFTLAEAKRRGRDVTDKAQMFDWDHTANAANVYKRHLQTALAELGMPNSRWHDLRHTFAVLSLSAGEHYMAVSKWLGHAQFTTTLNVYGDYISSEEGGKAAPLTRPSMAPVPVAHAQDRQERADSVHLAPVVPLFGA
ncbi:site-specific integrase [Tsukamurella strandjordii]|uniref:Tyrosine-type recombinase/integrase n=1 Tax=Tsukamurella strandjordii TaxID=147577 RepID=A0AA90NAI5_9ACTN|nr:site-specific integrase [Tsukamurella strandjordii]MDP0398912.1 tyrosine-type recombinase/integrase [Tsukamurella strandjordii]